jgi:glycine/D-amino acid oxidase-like deaminating enzyme
MTSLTAEVVVCGAGLAGISAAYYLAVHEGINDVILVDERAPLTMTSDKSTECYRNWWPGPSDTMVRFMNHSIDLLEKLANDSNNYFGLNRRGYIFLTANHEQAELYRQAAEEISALGAGPIRTHEPGRTSYLPSPPEGYKDMPIGADIVHESSLIREHYPFLTDEVVAMLHTRRCGWLSAQQLGMYMLNQVKARGTRFLSGRVTGVETQGGRISSVDVQSGSKTTRIQTRVFVNAAGPLAKEVAGLIGVDLPVINELHGKIAFSDSQNVLPRDVPLMIWSDPVRLPWSADEQRELSADEETRWLLDEFPPGVHFRPEGLGHSQAMMSR